MKKLMIAAACVVLSTPAFSVTLSEKTGVNSALGISPSTADFVKEAAISDMFEIKSSELAAQKGDAATKAFANQMITDHSKTSSELKSMVQSGKVKATLPTEMDNSHKSKLTKLQRLDGKAFIRQYDSDQVSAHKSAVGLFKRYGKGGADAALKSWAASTLPTLQHHLQMAQANYKKS